MKSSSRVLIFMLFSIGVVLMMMDCARRATKQKKAHANGVPAVEAPIPAP